MMSESPLFPWPSNEFGYHYSLGNFCPLTMSALLRRISPMTTPSAMFSTRILNSLPNDIQSAISTYAREAQLTAQAVIEYAISQFLALDTTLTGDSPYSSEDTSLLAELPTRLQSKARQYAQAAEMPPDFVIELAITHFLDPDSMTFDDCRVKVQQISIECLKQHANTPAANAA
jgi:predicted transcriptional regulator